MTEPIYVYLTVWGFGAFVCGIVIAIIGTPAEPDKADEIIKGTLLICAFAGFIAMITGCVWGSIVT
jgi:hypothetical protein